MVDEQVEILILDQELEPITVHGTICYITQVRNKSGKITISGVRFDLKDRKLAATLEPMFAKIQRDFLRSIRARTDDQQIQLMF